MTGYIQMANAPLSDCSSRACFIAARRTRHHSKLVVGPPRNDVLVFSTNLTRKRP